MKRLGRAEKVVGQFVARRLQPAVQRVRATPVQRWFTGVRSGVGYVGGLWGRYVCLLGCSLELYACVHDGPSRRQARRTMGASQSPLHLQTRGPFQKQLCTVCALPQIVSRAHMVPQVLSDSLALQAERDSWSWQRALPARRAPPADVHPAGASSSCP